MVRMVGRVARTRGALGVGRRGLYEIIMAFFVVTVIVFAVIAFMFMNVSSSTLYAQLKQGSRSQTEAIKVKDVVLSCHRLEYLDEALMDRPCRAKEMLKGYRVEQLTLNDCDPKTWDFAKGEYSSAVPFVLNVAQADSGKKCLAKLYVLTT